MLVRLLALVCAPVELAEAEVAVGDEGAHAEAVSGCEGLLVVCLGLRERDRVSLGDDFPQQPMDLRLVAALTVFTGQVERPPRAGDGLCSAPGMKIGLSQRHQREGIEATRRFTDGDG